MNPFRLRMSIARFRGGERSVHLAMKKCSTVLLVTDITKSIAKLAIYARTSPDQQPGNDETNLSTPVPDAATTIPLRTRFFPRVSTTKVHSRQKAKISS